ncbi:acyltransferase family protein [Pedococcus bigeumensis]|uniref:acyltransferase family protein n=1 Tax=Pedococcus bigeumensis TaxID=433644 RepID=UPI001386D00F|nr:acyltransferase [Pedococcus bigeumensis]
MPALTGLRVLAASWVVLFHYRPDLEALAPWTTPADTFMQAGYLGVDLFFPLSGFILAYNYADSMSTFSRQSAISFIRNRFARVWPVHFVALNVDLAMAVAMGTLGIGEGGHRRTPAAYGQNVLMVHNWFNDRPSFNGPAWSIASEWFAYLLAPLLFVLVARVVRARTSVLFAALSYAAMLTVFALFALPNGNLEHMFYVRIMGEFIAGMFLCLAWVRGGLSLGRLAPLLPVVVLAVALVPAVSSSDYWMAPAMGLVVAVVASAGGWVGSWLSTSFMVAAGEASYCLYMTHYLMRPVVTWLREWGDDAWWSAALAVAALVLALGAAAWLMHVLVERPARRLVHVRSRTPEPAPVGAGHHGPQPDREDFA